MTDISDHWDPYDDEPYPDDDPDDWYDDDPEPDEPDWSYEEWRAGYEDHCIETHGGADCDCRAPLAERIRQSLRDLRRRAVSKLRRDHYFDEPPF